MGPLNAHTDCDFALFKTPDTPNRLFVVLIVVVVVTRREVHVPRVVVVVLRRTPVERGRKPAKRNTKAFWSAQGILCRRESTAIQHSPFVAFKQKHARS
ncbi:TPA: hypothetical protein U6356_002935 [Legionella pneumophila]|uniref:Uncharacterized protein n=1 Tax=Legionella pneumophila TaxID=446 RepID=A0AAN5KTX6_LEGPN|nr:hypothetical protein [Legionella pneumophila]MDI9826526.1 hypothetical protein [Legionella pneumophila]HAT1597769.1 hypothetical protein [Legionella pneumophila]HAT1740854.1 hypothetical protein [Legionella pneumophila]HAT1746642.1 hypothetical protein [Legionella pneumophila]HAT1749550.1 hypothetical protein [Legionella pneumophila]